MHEKPQKEHEWLHQLLGDWRFESECSMGPDQPKDRYTGVESVRSLDGLWVVCDIRGDAPGGCQSTSIMTLGFNPAKKRFIGTFVASMMTHLWLYDGGLDPAEKVLTLDAEGPSFSGDGTMAKYQDIIEILSPDHRTLSSRFLDPAGTWHHFMTAHYRRTK